MTLQGRYDTASITLLGGFCLGSNSSELLLFFIRIWSNESSRTADSDCPYADSKCPHMDRYFSMHI